MSTKKTLDFTSIDIMIPSKPKCYLTGFDNANYVFNPLNFTSIGILINSYNKLIHSIDETMRFFSALTRSQGRKLLITQLLSRQILETFTLLFLLLLPLPLYSSSSFLKTFITIIYLVRIV